MQKLVFDDNFGYSKGMQCPNDNENLEKVLFHNVEVDYCPKCLGIWFDGDEFALAKNDKDKNLNWLDIDLWRDKSKFKVMRISKFCPICRVGLVEINYDESKTKVDFCKKCNGVWLDRGEFKQIINYLKSESMGIDSLARTLNVPASKLGTTLSLMQLKGIVNQEAGKYYVN